MPPKGKKASAAEKAKDVQETEEPLQAVVLADAFETRFSPFTLEKPRCLLPLVNIPLIEYTFEFLTNSGVEEVFVYCGAHTDQIEEYIERSKWSRPASPFRTEVIRSTSKSVGDAMRDLDKKGIMSGDFIVVYGDVVSNLPLGPALAEHRARRAKDKNAIMTMVLREAGAKHRTKAQGLSPVFVLDPAKDRCLHYEQISRRQPNKRVELDAEVLSGQQEIELRHDLLDCGIDICTPDVLALWSDNFDYEAPRKNFLHSVLKDYELNGKTIHTYITKDHYAARVRNLRAYDAVSKDIVSLWAFPICPDSNLYEGQKYSFRKGNVYEEDGLDVTWTSLIGRDTVVGRGTKVGKNSRIVRSVIGRACQIGDDCVIEDSYLWDGAVVEDCAEVKRAIVASDAVVGRKCSVSEGTLLSYGVRISGSAISIRSRRFTTAQQRAHQPLKAVDVKLVGEDGVGHEIIPSDDEDEDTKSGLIMSVYEKPDFAASTESISTLHSDLPEEEEKMVHHPAESFLSVASDEAGGVQGEAFVTEASTSIYDGFKENVDVSTIQLELQSLRMSADASQHQVRRAIAAALIKHIIEVRKNGSRSVKDVLTSNTMLIERSMFDSEAEEKVDQVDFLLLVQKELASSKSGAGHDGIMLQICNDLYLGDVLQQEGLEQWWEDERSCDGERIKAVRTQVQKFMEVLVAEESEDEEESDEEDDDDEEDEDE